MISQILRKTKSVIRSSTYLNACVYIFYFSLKIRLKNFLNLIEGESGATHQKFSTKDSVNYITNVFTDYCKASNISEFFGDVLELGPGDNAGVGLLFLANGAQTVSLVDRFYSKRNNDQQLKIYQELERSYPAIKKLFENGKTNDPDTLPQLKRFYGREASAERFLLNSKSYDFIVSRSVLEHIDKPTLVLKKMYNALRPGGALIHKVDLRDHGMFPLTSPSTKYLELPQWLYWLMVYSTGYPNRFLFHQYKQILRRLNPDTEFYISRLHGIEEDLSQGYKLEDIPKELILKSKSFIEKHRSKFASPFTNVNAEDLMVSGFFFVCKKDRDE